MPVIEEEVCGLAAEQHCPSDNYGDCPPVGVVSLYDVLKFAADNFWKASQALAVLRHNTKLLAKPPHDKEVMPTLNELLLNLKNLGLGVSLREFEKFNQWMNPTARSLSEMTDPARQKVEFDRVNEILAVKIDQLCSVVHSELESQIFFQLPPERRDMWKSDWLADTPIYQNFPKAHQELQCAGRCYGYGEATACVFHLMRVIDSGLRIVYESLGESYDARNWDGIAKKIESEMSKKYQDKTQAWRDQEPLYSEVLTDIRSIGRAHRNPALHDLDRKYTDGDALYLIEVTKSFMSHLAKHGMKESII